MRTLAHVVGRPLLVKDMIHSEHADAPKQEHAWLEDPGQEYDTFTRTFVEPRQSVLRLHGEAKGSEQFGAHVAGRAEATPSGDGGTPGEQTINNDVAKANCELGSPAISRCASHTEYRGHKIHSSIDFSGSGEGNGPSHTVTGPLLKHPSIAAHHDSIEGAKHEIDDMHRIHNMQKHDGQRMSEDDGRRYHPAATETAKALEHAGYVQTHHKDLEDEEDVLAVDGRNGNVAPVRHHKFGEFDEGKIVDRHIIEAYPGSPHHERMPLKHAYAESAEGGPYSRLAFFRMTHPDHATHGKHLYAARDARHRDG